MTSRNWKTRKQTWQIFLSFCAFSSCKPNNVIVFEYLMSDMGSICEGPGFWGEEEEVCITLTSGAAAPAVPPYLSRYSRLRRLFLALPFIFNYTLVTCKTHGGTETADRCTTSFMMLLWLPEIPLWLLWPFYSHIEYKNVESDTTTCTGKSKAGATGMWHLLMRSLGLCFGKKIAPVRRKIMLDFTLDCPHLLIKYLLLL